MQIEPTTFPSTILQFAHHRRPQSTQQPSNQQSPYFTKHWQVIQTSIKFFILEKASVNIVAFKKSLELLVLHRHSTRIREHLLVLWREMWGHIVRNIQQNETNPLISLIQFYKVVEDRMKIVFTILGSYLDHGRDSRENSKIDGIDQLGKLQIHKKSSVETEAYNILCKLILESPRRTQYEQQMILLISAFRNSNYSSQSIISQETCKAEVRIDLLILKKIGLFRHLEPEFDLTSKQFYVQLSEDIPKDSSFLFLVNEYLYRQIDLNKIFEPKISTVYYVEKQLIREFYDFVLDNLLEEIIQKKEKKALKILWNFTLRLKEEALKAFSQKLKQIIRGVKKYFVKNANMLDVFKLIDFRESLFELTEECFQKNRKVFNLIYHTFEEVLYEEEKHYLNVALNNILQEKFLYEEEPTAMMAIDEETEGQNRTNKTSKGFDQSSYFKLFRITPSKENFIKEFEIKFSKWIIQRGFEMKTLRMQEKMIHQMKKEVGNNLMKCLDRMLNDVYRQDQMHYHTQTMSNGTLMKCMFLSSNWPVNLSIVFNTPDELYNMQNDFESEFKKGIQNKEKSVKWISEIGTLRIAIHGVESIFSELQAAIIMILDKSIRPLKKDQIQASLNICNMNQSIQNFSSQAYLSTILSTLVTHNILTLNPGPQTYDINDDNTIPYTFTRAFTQSTESVSPIKRVENERDNTILIEAAVVKILKKRKNMQRSDITKFIEETIKRFKPTFEQITKTFEKLQNSHYIEINREKGIISYVE